MPKKRVSQRRSAMMSSKPKASSRPISDRLLADRLKSMPDLEPDGTWAPRKFQVAPALRRPEHSTLRGPAHWGGQKPGAPQVMKAMRVKVLPTFWTSTQE